MPSYLYYAGNAAGRALYDTQDNYSQDFARKVACIAGDHCEVIERNAEGVESPYIRITIRYEESRPLRVMPPDHPHCQAGRDGDCYWKHCPQTRDGEPGKSGRHCPLDHRDDSEF